METTSQTKHVSAWQKVWTERSQGTDHLFQISFRKRKGNIWTCFTGHALATQRMLRSRMSQSGDLFLNP